MESSRSSKKSVGSRLQPGSQQGRLQGYSTKRSRLGTVPRWEQRALEFPEGKKEGSFRHKDQLSKMEMLSGNSLGVFNSQAESISCLVKLRNVGRVHLGNGLGGKSAGWGMVGKSILLGGLLSYGNVATVVQKNRSQMGFAYSLETTIQWEG